MLIRWSIDFHTTLTDYDRGSWIDLEREMLVAFGSLVGENELPVVRSSDDKDTDNITRTTVDPFLKGPQLARERKQPSK